MNELYGPGADAQANNECWNENPLGENAPKRRLGEDSRLIIGQE